MIPKIIHYCWFGGAEKPQQVLECIASWKKHLQGYQYYEWNESNFDITKNRYCKQAYDQKKWAFVSDYARLQILYDCGGIYMDTDVMLYGSFDKFLHHKAFTGFENIGYPVTAVMGSELQNPIIKEMLDYYADIDFEHIPYPHTITNTIIMADILAKNGIDRYRNEYQEIDNISIYPQDIFCASFRDEKTNRKNDNTIAIHLMLGSWG